MIDDLRGQSKETVLDYFYQRGFDTHCYSCYYKGLKPLLENQDVYLYTDNNEVVIVTADPCPSHPQELADEEPFNGTSPKYFTESGHRTSPVWKLAVTCKMMEERLSRISKHAPRVWGLLLTGSHLLNFEDMTGIWNKLNVSVIDRMSGLEDLFLLVNPDTEKNSDIPLALSSEAGFSQDNVVDAEKEVCRLLGTIYPRDIITEANTAEDDTEDHLDTDLFDWDLDDYDLNDDVQDCQPLPAVDKHIKDAISSNMENKKYLMQHVTSVSLQVSTGSRTPLYAKGSATVVFSVEKHSRLASNRFKCFVYSKDYYPMCNSAIDGKERHSKNGVLKITMPCDRVWMPGDYMLLVQDGPEMAVRFNFTLDVHLNATLGAMKPCSPCGEEDILISCIEPNNDNWSSLASYPGVAQLRRHAIRERQLDVYNTFRISRNGKPIGAIKNLLICTRNGDLDEQVLKQFFGLKTLGGLHFAYTDCSRLYDPSKPNPYEYLNDEFGTWRKCVICLSGISSLLNTGGKTIVRKVLEIIYDKERDNRLWICGTCQELDALLDMHPSLGRLFLRGSRLEQEPYSAFDLVQAFCSQLQKEAMEMTPKVTDALTRAVYQGHKQGALSSWSMEDIHRFVVEEVRPRYLKHALSSILSERLPRLSKEDLCLDMLTNTVSTFESSIQELNAMIGLDEVKSGIFTMANNVRLFLERRRKGLHTSGNMVFHSIFTGNPGTGKTTVARMMGKIYHSLGLLSRGEVVTVDRTRLVGRYIGETEENMKQVLGEARGNVLFIDEAYTLYDGSGDHRDFGCRVLDSLLTVLAQPNPDMLVIFAGYTKEMNDMLMVNPGLSGRFPYRYQFNDYSAEQLVQIAHRLFQRDEYVLTEEAEAELLNTIEQILSQEITNFSNARWVEQFVHNGIIPALADRVFSSGSDDLQHIEASDIRKAYEKFNPNAIALKSGRHRVPGFRA